MERNRTKRTGSGPTGQANLPRARVPGTVTRGRDLAGLAAFAAISLAVYGANGLVTAISVGGWYPTLVKPPLTPPDWVFAPAWGVLFVLIALAGWRAWRSAPWPVPRAALVAWGVHLALNLGWSVLFFGLRAMGAALVEIALLLAAILVTAVLFRRHDGLAALLLAPYAAWVAFAAYLNAGLWVLNP